MELILFALIGIATGWIAGTVAKEYGFGITWEVIVGFAAAIAGGTLFDYAGFNPLGLTGSLSFAVITAVVVLFLTKLYRPSHHQT